jgi:hypothetical protein
MSVLPVGFTNYNPFYTKWRTTAKYPKTDLLLNLQTNMGWTKWNLYKIVHLNK